MGKSRMTALDLRAVANSLNQQCQSLRVANVYDISSKVYVLKLSTNNEADKKYLLLQSGIRAHLSNWKRNKQAVPSVFTMKLRKFLRTKRITEVRQLGSDRVLDIKLGQNENAVHLIVELYSRGNIILTDCDYVIISAWRQFKTSEDVAVAIKSEYPHKHYEANDILERRICGDNGAGRVRELVEATIAEFTANAQPVTKKNPAKTGLDIVAQLVPSCHRQMVAEQCTDYLKDLLVFDAANDLDKCCAEVETVLNRLYNIWEQVTRGPWLGYVYSKGEEFVNLSPYRLSATEGLTEKQYDSFHDAADDYFTTAEVKKAEKVEGERLTELESKVEKIRKDQYERVHALEEAAKTAELYARAVEFHVPFISKVLEMMKRLVDSGADWKVLQDSIKEQSRNNHPVASYITDTDFKNSRVEVLIPASNWGDEEDFDSLLSKYQNNHRAAEAIEVDFGDDDSSSNDSSYSAADDDEPPLEENSFIKVWLNYKLSGYANVKALHEEKKQSLLKFEKTKQAASAVLKQAEQLKAREAAKKSSAIAQQAISRTRKVFWFERFYWFISSDHYLVIGGHDAMQNEILYKKYLGKDDLYVHADVHGAASCIVRNHHPSEPIPQSTIQEAGIMSVCRSNAWKNKVLTTAYWVHANQVSKTPQAGEYVSTGGFIIRGKRNPIIVNQLELGICLMFCLGDAESIARHQQQQYLAEGHTPPDTPPLKRKDSTSAASAGAKVQFGQCNIAPTPIFAHSVDFNPEQTEVIPIRSDRSVLSPLRADEEECALLDKYHAGCICAEEEHQKGTYCRPDSADELPPPTEYADRAAPGPLLRKETPETKALDTLMREIKENPASPVTVKTLTRPGRRLSRDRVDQVGPVPRHYLPENPPNAKLLMSTFKRDGPLPAVPSPIMEECPTPEPAPPLSPKSKSGPKGRGRRIVEPTKPAGKSSRTTAAKHAKIKKMKKKYGDQSDDEREVAMQLMGAKKMKEELTDDADGAEAAEGEKKRIDFNVPSKPQYEVVERRFDEAEEAQVRQEWQDKMSALAELTGRPLESDTLLFSLPMVAPMSAIRNHKFKGRILPGGGKKGQAISIMHRAFIEMAPAESRVRNLVRQITADEFSAVVPSTPLVQMEGALKIQKADRKEKRSLKQIARK